MLKTIQFNRQLHMEESLSAEQKEEFKRKGFLSGLPIFSKEEMEQLNKELPSLLTLLEDGETTKDIREWHETSKYLLDICLDNRILNYVEQLLEVPFYMWASNFFIKEPHTKETVDWHQDSYYWPLDPKESVTVWIAFDDVDVENGAMQVIPSSHKVGIVNHIRKESDSVLSLVADTSQFNLEDVETLSLKKGSISIHDDKLMHCSPSNPSNRRRAGFTIRFSPDHVACDLTINPNFNVYPARGKLSNSHPKGEMPTERFGRIHHKHLNVEESEK